jgi:RNA polymerase sigma-70 factor (ECF subfamily)
LLQVARRKALDAIRREDVLRARAPAIAEEMDARLDTAEQSIGVFDDDQLRLMLLCCHPSLSPDSRVALTLRMVGGFGVGEIARAFLADESAMAQRLVRAKRTLREADAPLTMPLPAAIPGRLDAVVDALYLMFNEGHTAHEGEALLRRDLCNEALRLVELLLGDTLTAQPRVHALAALFSFLTARLDTRTDEHGALVLLSAQDRAKWDRRLIERGLAHLDASAFGEELTQFHLEAEIAAAHATAPSWNETDWTRILTAYDRLHAITQSPVVALNRVVAIRELRGARVALEELEPLGTNRALQSYHLFHSVRGELLHAVGRAAEAQEAFRRAISLARSDPIREHARTRLAHADTTPHA